MEIIYEIVHSIYTDLVYLMHMFKLYYIILPHIYTRERKREKQRTGNMPTENSLKNAL